MSLQVLKNKSQTLASWSRMLNALTPKHIFKIKKVRCEASKTLRSFAKKQKKKLCVPKTRTKQAQVAFGIQ